MKQRQPSQASQRAPSSDQSRAAPATQQAPSAEELVDPWATPMLDQAEADGLGATNGAGAADGSPDGIADTLIRATRGDPVPPDELTSAQLGVDSLDDDGVAVVLDRLQQAGMLDAVVDRGLLEADQRDQMLDRADGLIPISVLVVEGMPETVVDNQIAWAEAFWAEHGMQVMVVSRETLPSAEAARILGLAGNDGAMDFSEAPNRPDPSIPAEHPVPPGQEPAALLARAWRTYGDASASHTVFVPNIIGAEGINIDSDTYETATPGVVVAQGATMGTLAHELGHHLGLEHAEFDEDVPDDDIQNLMYRNGPNRARLEPEQVRAVKRSLRTRLVPRGTVDRSGGRYRDANPEFGLIRPTT